jgi:hypothetical protein
MAAFHETAIFRPDEPDCLVVAGLACRVCLSAEVDWQLRGRMWDHEASCRCRACGHERTVALTPDQALRLALREDATEPAAPTPLAGLAAVV